MASSASPSISPSVSVSPSLSASVSPSVSVSPSFSASFSPSLSPSLSPSVSPSVSPSPVDLYYPPTQNGLQKTLAAKLDTGNVTSATFNNTTNIQNERGLFVVDRIDSSGTEKAAAVREYISFGQVSGATVTTLARGLGGTTDQDHATGAVVEFVMDVVQQQAILDTITTEHNTTGTHTNALVTTLKATGAVVNTGTSDVTIVTPKAIADSALTTPTKTQVLTNKTLTAPIIRGWDGWEDANETWTYASATTITVPTDATTKYSVGDRIKFTQTTVKYFVITAVASTVLTVNGGSDYTVANAAITLNYYSKEATPLSFPLWFNYTSTFTGFSDTPTRVTRFTLNGRTMTVQAAQTGAGTSNATSKTWTLPIASGQIFGQVNEIINAGASAAGRHIGSAGSTTVNVYPAVDATAWTASGNAYLFPNGLSLTIEI